MTNINTRLRSLTMIIALFFVLVSFIASTTATAKAANPLATPKPVTGVVDCKPSDTDPNSCIKSSAIYLWLEYFINLFVIISVFGSAAMVGYAGIEYTTSGGNAEKTKAARDKIKNVVIGLLALVFMWAFLQWLIPGGIFDVKK